MAKITFSKLADDEVANIIRIGACNNEQADDKEKITRQWMIYS